MDKEKIRQIFKGYRQQIANLKEQIVGLEEERDNQYYFHEEAISRVEKRTQVCRNEIAERERQEQLDRWDREDKLRSATKDLERARSYGDDWGVERALQKLKGIY